MTIPPSSHGNAGAPARALTEPLRELSAFALLAGNAVFQLLGVTGLFFVVDNWGSDFGRRSAEAFPRFAGLLALGLPILALLVATHVAPMLRRSRLIIMVVLAEYAASAFFGAITFLGAFAYDLRSPRATMEGLLDRLVWLTFLVLACIIAARVWLGLFPGGRTPGHHGYRPTYGKPYPGQPLFPQPGRQAGSPTPEVSPGWGGMPTEPATAGGWPTVPPPPMPQPLVVDVDPTMRLSPPLTGASEGDETAIVPVTRPDDVDQPTQRIAP